MAKKKNEEILDVNEVLNSEEDVKEAEKEEVVSDVIIEKVETNFVEEKVKIKLRKYHRCFIGGEWYDFQPDKVYIVPKNVKEILLKNDLLLPL